ncbi:MAG: peptidoglycan recognition family protein [Patescibacteria group bacterium]
MEFSKLIALGLASSLALAGCKEKQPVHETRSKVAATVQPSATPVADAGSDAGTDAKTEKPKIVCRPKEVILPGIKVVPRSEWAPLPPNLEILGNMENCDNYPIEKITLHHTGDWVITKPGEGRKMAGADVYLHLGSAEKKRGKGWGDVAYHCLVTPEGEILEGRNPAFRGDSNTQYYPNDKNHSHTPEHHLLISVVGNYEKEEQEFTAEARLAVFRVLMASLRYYDLKPGDVIFHKDVAYTGCPGSQIIDWYKTSGRYQIANQMKLQPK